MRTLILGAGGQLGRDLVHVFEQDHEVAAYRHNEVDITEGGQVARLVVEARPEVVINAAGYNDVDGAEDNRDAAYLVNETGARNVALAAARQEIPVVHFSTDFVFDGARREAYEPGDAINPLNVYAKSKAAGEAAVRLSNHRHFIVRTAWLYGPGGNNFVERILSLCQDRDSVRVVDDQYGSPTHTFDLAEATERLCRTRRYGIFHIVNNDSCCRYTFAQAIVAEAGMKCHIEPCSSNEFKTRAKRPAYSVLSSGRYEKITGRIMRPWRTALGHYMKRRQYET
ncbi:MAG: dTDP-4-dehydrorhamnose reductase [Candidatus Hydrogenedentes bacterium]|nr:dTDP-4-dehydrorhamnose reductase [Candidatus Hydrogenedentota bacterium]